MDTAKQEFIAWLDKMGYDGEITDSITELITPATLPVFKQLMTKVKPKQEVELIGKNLLVHRLARKDRTSDASSRELEVYEKKLKLEARLEELKKRKSEKIRQVEKLALENRQKYIILENIERKVEEHRKRTNLLRMKRKQLEEDLDEVTKMLQKIQEITPIPNLEGLSDDEMIILLTDFKKKQLKVAYEGNTLTDSSLITIDDVSTLNDSQFLTTTANEASIDLKETVKKILHENSREVIWRSVIGMNEKLSVEMKDVCMGIIVEEKSREKPEMSKMLMHLYKEHIKWELMSKKIEKEVERLKNVLSQKENCLMDSYASKGFQPEKLSEIKTQMEKYENEAMTEAKYKKINSLIKTIDRSTNFKELKTAEQNLRDVQKKIIKSLSIIQDGINKCNDLNEKIRYSRIEIAVLVKKLQRFGECTDWLEPLSNNVISEEIKVFKDFPLEFNPENSKSATQPIHTIKLETDADTESLPLLAALLDSPHSFPDREIRSINATHRLVADLCSLDVVPIEATSTSFDFVGLLEGEGATRRASERMRALVEGEVGDVSRRVREELALWNELPFWEFIDGAREVEGVGFGGYQEMALKKCGKK